MTKTDKHFFWWISFPTNTALAELESSQLFDLGAAGTEEQNTFPEIVNPVGDMLLKACFMDKDSFEAAKVFFQEREGLAFGEEEQEDWDQSWRLQQKPLAVTDHLTVMPPWLDAEPHGVTLKLEAKMAFGTGSHETTRLCALMLEELDCKDKTVLDIGTGTGILALYAAFLGAKQTIAHDIDPVTGPCLRENFELNIPPQGHEVIFFVGGLEALKESFRFDIILCNMIRTELWPFREELFAQLKPSGLVIVSGQLHQDREHFVELQKTIPFHFVQEKSLNEWWGFVGQLNSDIKA